MKALSLTEPWAMLVALNLKKVETRSWRTHYRGRLYIHAAKAFPRWAQELAQEHPFRDALNRPNDELPRGCLIATAVLVDCLETGWLAPLSQQELAFGDYTEGRWAWFLEDVEALQHPIPYRGSLGLFNVELPI